jgi:hypothetical protein
MNEVRKEDVMVRKAMVVLVALCVWVQTAQAAVSEKETHYWSDAGYGTLAVFANLLYMPVKVVYSTLGVITGGLAYCLTVGDSNTAERVWSPSVGGSYVITPAMLRGDEPMLFNGPSYTNG